ncbi:bifunctional DNA primase/polymerase [Gordonia sp. NPDC057258]|uniref:bifunctional DNA primase/polymerase n=1 Tax=unclassified Gordonia (in: high G+C Gram-positive bacteria) TaxID=2657482 RepID=UPI00362ABAEF
MKIEPHALTHPRTRTDADWRAKVGTLVTPTNTTQAIALGYAQRGVIPIPIHPTDDGGKGFPETGYTGHVALPEPGTLATRIANMPDGQLLGIRLADNIIGLDIDTYDVTTTGGIVHKTGGSTITRLEAKLGPLPPTVWSSRREPISAAPEHRTGIYLYRVSDRTLTYHRRRGADYLRFRDLPPHVETLAFGFRYAMVAPSVIDGLPYQWHAPNGTVLDPLDLPDFDALPVLPDKWCARLLKDPRHNRSRRPLRTPGEHSGGGATYAEQADTADEWCAAHIPGWTAEPDDYLTNLAERYIADMSTRSRHLAARNGTTAILNAAIGNEQWIGHPGGQQALTRLAEAFLAAKPTTQALGDYNRQFAGAVDDITNRLATGELRPLTAPTIRTTQPQERAQ